MLNYPKEKLLLFSTLILSILLLVYLSLLYLIDPTPSSSYTSMVITNIIIGRVPSISLGSSLNLNIFEIVTFNFITEALMVLFFYTIFLYSLQNARFLKPLQTRIEKLQNAALKHHETVEKYGIIGLLIFVFMPFWMTGPVVGAIIGHLMNFSLLKNLGTVFTGTIFALFCWAFLIENFIEYIKIFL